MKKFLSVFIWLVLFAPVAIAAPTVQFVVTSTSSSEAAGTFTIALSITNPDANPTSVDITVLGGGSATSGVDYTYAPVTLTFPANSQFVEFVTVTVVNDQLIEGDESFTFSLNNPTNNATLGANTQHEVTITDNDVQTVEIISFGIMQYENIGAVNVPVRLTAPGAAATSVTVHLDIPNSTATPVSDFTFTDTTITWLPDSFGLVFIPIPVIDDALFEAPETVRVTLTNVTNNVAVGNDVFDLTILNNDSMVFTTCGDLFFSEYSHAGNEENHLEIYNPTAQPADLSQYRILVSFDGGDSVKIVNLAGTLNSGDVFVVARDGSRPALVNLADFLSPAFIWNGNDAIALLHNTDTIDIIGEIGNNPGFGYGLPSGGSTYFNVLIRNKYNFTGGYYWTITRDSWTSIGTDILDSLGAHTMATCGSSPPIAMVRFLGTDTTVPETTTGRIPIVVETVNYTNTQISFKVGHNNNLSSATFLADYSVPVPFYTHGTGVFYDTVWAAVIDDQLVESTENALLYLTNLTGHAIYGADSLYNLYILDNDVPTLSFNGAGFSYVEDTDMVLIKITLSGELPDATHVTVTLAEGSATRNVDYVFTDTTVIFPANSIDTLGVWVRIINDTMVEPNEQINFNLTTTDSTLFKSTIAYTLTIIDDDFVLGIDETTGASIRMYPNPVYGMLTLDAAVDLAQVCVTNVMGTTLLTAGTLPAGNHTIDVSALPAGMYFISGSYGQKTFGKRFIKLD